EGAAVGSRAGQSSSVTGAGGRRWDPLWRRRDGLNREYGTQVTRSIDELIFLSAPRFASGPRHSITSSAICCRCKGTLSTNALAVLRLIRSSNLVGCSTGRSPGLAPLRILSAKTAAR